MTRTAFVTFAGLLLAAPAPAADSTVSFRRDVRPILSNTCFKCHGPDLKKAGLDLQSFDGATKRLPSGVTAVVPGKAAASELLKRVTLPHGDEAKMPPKADLTPAQVATLRAWVDQGAKYEEHWAYVKPARPAVPQLSNSKLEPRNPIDNFAFARLAAEGLSPMPEAERAVLLRRLSLDLTGLPPSPAEVTAFEKDTSPDAYEKAVDRLLASPHYGEHMARWWLDLARYADTNGYEKDDRRTVWPYRDWVIAAFNRDLPFDRFTVEQLAGDLLPNATAEQKVATGFHRNTMTNTEGGTDDEEFRVAAVVDRVNTTFEVWLGSTFGCAQCHNHKYDPFTQKEYYGVFAFFNNTADGGRSVAPELPLADPVVAARKDALRRDRLRAAVGLLAANPLAAVSRVRPAVAAAEALQKQDAAFKSPSTLVMQERPQPRETFVMVRGEFRSKGERVSPGVPAKLPPMAQHSPAPPGSRLAFAEWLVSPDNPLTARVTANRLWARFFGRGIVETVEDFGLQGELPTHPELLDWLAVDLVEGGWSLKAFQKRVVLSAAYRQSATATPAALEKDPANRLFSRGPRFRLDAETVRDNALAVGGLLSRKVGGPSVFPHQPDGVWANPYSGDRWATSAGGDQHRRGLYTFWRRTAPYAAFMAFDAPSREVACSRRPRTNTPLQALATLNDKAFVECANGLARRVVAESAGGPADRAGYAFRCCVSRAPTAAETAALASLYEDARRRYASDPAAAGKLAGAGPAPAGVTAAELAAWTVVGNVLLNLDEAVSKP